MAQSSMATQVAPLPHVHQQRRGGPMHGIDSDRHPRQSYAATNGTRTLANSTTVPLSPASSSAGSPNSHDSHVSEATHFGKDEDHYDTYETVPDETRDSSRTQKTDRTIVDSLEQGDRSSTSSANVDTHEANARPPNTFAERASNEVPAIGMPDEPSRHPSSIETVSAATIAKSDRGQGPLADHLGYETAAQQRQAPEPRRDGSIEEQHQGHGETNSHNVRESSEVPSLNQAQHEPQMCVGGAPLEPSLDPKTNTDPEHTPKEGNTRPRKHSKSNQTSASRAAAAAAEMNDDVLVGTRVTEGHENFVTAYNMLTGIRVAVSRCTAKVNRPLTDADFSATDEISFNLNGAGYNPSSKYMFRFKDYAPWVFRHLRDAFRLDPADYLMSLTAKYIVSELGSPGKSGSFFYYSRDYRFIIKTIRHSEHKLLRRILSQYYSHVKKYPDTLVSQFYGLHRVRLPFGRKIHFVVMNNVFPALYEIHERYDLKGSLLGREYNSNLTKPIVVYKDLDWLRRHRRVILGPQKRERLVKQLEIDARFLERVNVMDYSLLIGIHDMRRGNAALNTLLRLKEFGPQGEQAMKKEQRQASEALHGSKSTYVPPRNVQHEFLELQTLLQKANPEQLKEFDFADEYRSASYFYRDHGGFQSTNDANEEQDVIYYVGIIDFLTGYTFRKSVETFCKSLIHDRRELSAVPAQEYGERFLKFLRGCIGPEIKSSKPNKRNTDQSTNAPITTTGDTTGAGAGFAASEQMAQGSATPSRKPKQPTMVVSPKVSPQPTEEVAKEPTESLTETNSTAPNFYTPRKAVVNGAVLTPKQESNPSFLEGQPSPGVAVTSDISPSVTSRKPSPPSSKGRRPSVVGYGPNATVK